MAKMMDVDASEAVKTTQGFGYTSIAIDKIGAYENTIVQIVVDQTGSVISFKNGLEKMIETVISACKKSPRSMNLLARVTAFDADQFNDRVRIEEIHGFTTLSSIDPTQYNGKIKPDGTTPLYEATMEAITSVFDYAQKLYAKEYSCNAIIFIITDGENNVTKTATPATIKDKIAEIRRNEKVLESVRIILIGVNDKQCKIELDNFHTEANLDQFVSIGDATVSKLAKLADFVSESISSQSSALGSGGPSQPVTGFKF